ncbi:hypothetical protein LX15_000176 [Streptoalloteichus tenebrarius]|uniref:Uncharacterized protein n=1 Tax=Streptoalloteichus tenebrarius (strain ATCC 17920 / DSM 40477 / JCM 4838 / CBS 697.72 / NBRC 16177 / NCIMB 11028 / NRRL B-12390 / A12253. 1 / ISP 5477) TaxID=1933 RepID=A0ABT1HLV7_STRSD|nr:XRE family transcriptional regulator [Streptoalloteichus tenebrarius]MCP2256493.1 hypothetical protein [Streptoalloteichus tenebrarius]BFF04845.1 hypothetical protein GCM10020241_65200 [Streptoalloteichus tenebrarius]
MRPTRTPNDHLRRARERRESQRYPGHPLSRAELAEAVNAWIYENRNRRVAALDAHYVAKLERGEIRCPQDDYRAGLRAVLDVATDQELGFQPRHRSAPPPPPAPPAAVPIPSGPSAHPPALGELIRPVASLPTPGAVGRREITEIRSVERMYRAWDATHGSGLLRSTIAEHLRYANELLKARCPEPLREELYSAVGGLVHAAAFFAFDAGSYEEAERLFRAAAHYAELGGDWHLRAKVLCSLARTSFWRGDPDSGLTWIEYAMVRADRLTHTERAMLTAVRSRALALLGRVQDTIRAVGEADEYIGQSNPADDPPWAAYYDAAEHAGETGHALADLARHGHRADEAAARLREAILHHGPEYARARAFCQLRLARLTLAVGDPREAVLLGEQGLTSATTIRSHRITTVLLTLGQAAERHRAIPEVAALRDAVAEAVTP